MDLHPIVFWLSQALASLVMAAAVLGLGRFLQRRGGIADGARGYWLGAWAVAAIVPLAVALLQWAAPAAVPALPVALPLPQALETSSIVAPPSTMALPSTRAWPGLGGVLLGLYGLGFAVAALRWGHGAWTVARLRRLSTKLHTGDLPGARCRAQAQRLRAQGISLRVTEQAITPFATRWPSPGIVLPADAVHRLDDAGLSLVIGHEAAHLRLRDPQRALLMAVVGAVLWFNPFLRLLERQVQLACELRCDAHALRGDADDGHALATAYVQTLRRYAAAPAPSSALSHRGFTAHALRIGHMLRGGAAGTLSVPQRLGAAAAGLVLAALVGGMQLLPAMAASNPPASATGDGALPVTPRTAAPRADDLGTGAGATAPARLALAAPLATLRVTGHFGDNGGPRASAHRGMDFGARVGTPVLAPAAGTVIAATDDYPGGPQYGRVVVLDHGDGWQTLYAHLDSYQVQVGQQVTVGDPIARVGRSGKVTGPHLHLEVLHHGQRLDPQTLLQ